MRAIMLFAVAVTGKKDQHNNNGGNARTFEQNGLGVVAFLHEREKGNRQREDDDIRQRGFELPDGGELERVG